jgi:hypothetical protein
LADPAHALCSPGDGRAVILLMMVGGPSQLETFDPKPDAPSDVRGPFRSIATSVPGIRVGEHLPGVARRMDRLTLIRSLHHDAAPIHETGQQLLQTGRLARPGREWPSIGSVAARLLGPRGEAPPFVVLPRPIGNTGVGVPRGQSAGLLGPEFDPFVADSDASLPALDLASERRSVRDAYGRTPFGDDCLRARRLVESGSRLVVVNMYETVFGGPSWDCHGRSPFSTFEDYASTVIPTFDRAFSALIDDLTRLGRLSSTFVVATGEFGRTPKLNASGGRDHWPGVWSALLAGGDSAGGAVIGRSDPLAAEPTDRPISPIALAATIYRALGIDPSRPIPIGQEGMVALIDDAGPIV